MTAQIELTLGDSVTVPEATAFIGALEREVIGATYVQNLGGARRMSFALEDVPSADAAADEIMLACDQHGVESETLTVRAGGVTIFFHPSTRQTLEAAR